MPATLDSPRAEVILAGHGLPEAISLHNIIARNCSPRSPRDPARRAVILEIAQQDGAGCCRGSHRTPLFVWRWRPVAQYWR